MGGLSRDEGSITNILICGNGDGRQKLGVYLAERRSPVQGRVAETPDYDPQPAYRTRPSPHKSGVYLTLPTLRC